MLLRLLEGSGASTDDIDERLSVRKFNEERRKKAVEGPVIGDDVKDCRLVTVVEIFVMVFSFIEGKECRLGEDERVNDFNPEGFGLGV